MTIGEFLKNYRAEHDMSQRELAKKCDLSNSIISMLEKGFNPHTQKEIDLSVTAYAKIANGIGMTVRDLFIELGDDAPIEIRPWVLKENKQLRMAFDSAPQQKLNKDDEELIELWTHASETAKQAALAVLKAMEGVK